MKETDASAFIDAYLEKGLSTWGLKKSQVCVALKDLSEFTTDPDKPLKAKYSYGEYATVIDLDAIAMTDELDLAAHLERGLAHELVRPLDRYRKIMIGRYGISPEQETVFSNATLEGVKAIEKAIAGFRLLEGQAPGVSLDAPLEPEAAPFTPLSASKPFGKN